MRSFNRVGILSRFSLLSPIKRSQRSLLLSREWFYLSTDIKEKIQTTDWRGRFRWSQTIRRIFHIQNQFVCGQIQTHSRRIFWKCRLAEKYNSENIIPSTYEICWPFGHHSKILKIGEIPSNKCMSSIWWSDHEYNFISGHYESTNNFSLNYFICFTRNHIITSDLSFGRINK